MNGKTIKLKNKRVSVGRCENEDIILEFRRIKEKFEQGSSKVSITHLRLTPAAAVALYLLLGKECNIKDVVNYETSTHHGRVKKDL